MGYGSGTVNSFAYGSLAETQAFGITRKIQLRSHISRGTTLYSYVIDRDIFDDIVTRKIQLLSCIRRDIALNSYVIDRDIFDDTVTRKIQLLSCIRRRLNLYSPIIDWEEHL